MNDLPAAPHTAGFFEPVPNHSCYFACIRPHPGGGGETTVVNLDAVLTKASPDCIAEWTEKTYFLRTSKRLGTETKPFQLLRSIEGAPFLRYRKEYTVGFDEDPSLRELERLVCDTKNHHVALLQPDEIIMHWNGAPHSRLPQQGATPEDTAQRRKLIRCRTQPYAGWERYFARHL
jgi:hypothetical protein